MYWYDSARQIEEGNIGVSDAGALVSEILPRGGQEREGKKNQRLIS